MDRLHELAPLARGGIHATYHSHFDLYPTLILPDGGSTSRLHEVADGQERHESDQVEEEEHGAEGLGMQG